MVSVSVLHGRISVFRNQLYNYLALSVETTIDPVLQQFAVHADNWTEGISNANPCSSFEENKQQLSTLSRFDKHNLMQGHLQFKSFLLLDFHASSCFSQPRSLV